MYSEATGCVDLMNKMCRFYTANEMHQPVAAATEKRVPCDMSLQCLLYSETSAGDNNVYWFRHISGESLIEIAYILYMEMGIRSVGTVQRWASHQQVCL